MTGFVIVAALAFGAIVRLVAACRYTDDRLIVLT